MEYMPIVAAILSGLIVGGINVWVNFKNRVYQARKEQMVRGLFSINRIVTLAFQPEVKSNEFSIALDEVKTIFYLFGTKRERDLHTEIVKTMQNPNGNELLRDELTKDKVNNLVAELTAEIRNDLTRKGSWI